MKKITALLMICLVILTAITLSSCTQAQAVVASALSISSDFSGTRTVSVRFPLSVNIDSVKDRLIDEAPVKELSGVSFEYKGVGEDGYLFELSITFSDRDDYEKKVSALIGREARVCLSELNTVLTKGTRMQEDFDVRELVAFVERICASDANTRSLSFDYSENSVSIGSQAFNTGSVIDISEREGSPVSSITIDTVNLKDGMFDRTVTFSLPNQTYNSAKSAIETYFQQNVSSDAQYAGWSKKGENTEFTVIYQGVSLEMLREYTATLFSSSNEKLFYGDKDGASTPLSEGLTFEERFDTFAFIGENGAVPVHYSYSLPTETTHGDGLVNTDGVFKTAGEWVGGVYSFDTDQDAVSLRIPDGIQYLINGINFTLESLGNDTFKRTTDFLYSKTDGYDGMTYAQSYFKSKGANVSVSESDTDLILSVICEGSSGEITDMLVRCFGSGNFMSYQHNKSGFSLSDKTEFSDYVNIGYMLNSANANRPMTYTVFSSGAENIISLYSDTADTVNKSADVTALSIEIQSGVAAVTYKGNIPDVGRIVLFSVAGGVMLLIAVMFIIFFIRLSKRQALEEEGVLPSKKSSKKPSKKPKRQKKEKKKKKQPMTDIPAGFEDSPEDEKSAPSLAQTTTFSITELGILSKNKKYVDEINRDIEERMEADRLENLKKEIRAKEIEEMGEKVYGKPSKEQSAGKEGEAEDAFYDFPQNPVIPDLPETPEAPDFSRFDAEESPKDGEVSDE